MEKIIVNPKGVRGLGNIVSPNTNSPMTGRFGEYNTNLDTYVSNYERVYTARPITGSYLTLSYNKIMTSTGNLTVTATLKNSSDDSVITSKQLSCYFNNETYTATTNSSGVATFTLPVLDEGEYNFHIIWTGTQNTTAGCIRAGCFYCGDIEEIQLYSTNELIGNGDTCTLVCECSPNTAGATVTFSYDETTIGTATTDNNGVAVQTYTGAGRGEVNIIAEYDGLVSSSVTVNDLFWYDPMTSDVQKWTLSNSSLTASYTDDGTTLTNETTNTYSYTSNYTATDNSIIEFDIQAISSDIGQVRFYYKGADRYMKTTLSDGVEHHMKFICNNGSVSWYVDDVLTGTNQNITSSSIVRFQVNNAIVRIKEFKICSIGE